MNNKMKTIKIQEEVEIKQKDQTIFLEKGDKIKILTEVDDTQDFRLIPKKRFFNYENPSFEDLIAENNPILNKYGIVYKGWKQYAMGITGINYISIFYCKPDGTLWNTKGEALSYAKSIGLKNKRVKGERSSYGEVGGSAYTVSAEKLKDVYLDKNPRYGAKEATVLTKEGIKYF